MRKKFFWREGRALFGESISAYCILLLAFNCANLGKSAGEQSILKSFKHEFGRGGVCASVAVQRKVLKWFFANSSLHLNVKQAKLGNTVNREKL